MTFQFKTRFKKPRMIQLSNDDQDSGLNDPAWQFLAEYSLSEFMLDPDRSDEIPSRPLFHLVQDLGIPPEYLITIERAWIAFGKKVMERSMVRSNEGEITLPIYLRIYCQKKSIEGVRLSRASNRYTTESTPINQHSRLKMNGGWGFFLIEGGGGFAAGSASSPHHWIDLYLYQEGA